MHPRMMHFTTSAWSWRAGRGQRDVPVRADSRSQTHYKILMALPRSPVAAHPTAVLWPGCACLTHSRSVRSRLRSFWTLDQTENHFLVEAAIKGKSWDIHGPDFPPQEIARQQWKKETNTEKGQVMELLGSQQEWTVDTHSDMNQSEWKNLDKNTYLLRDSIYKELLKTQTTQQWQEADG